MLFDLMQNATFQLYTTKLTNEFEYSKSEKLQYDFEFQIQVNLYEIG